MVRVLLNGREAGELGVVAAIAGELGIPVGLVAGDDFAVKEAKKLLGKVETVVVKKSISRFHAQLIHPSITARLIKEAAKRAINRASDFKPLKVKTPVEVTVKYVSRELAEQKASQKGAKAIGDNTVLYKCKTVREARNLI